ncbi:hypothetical protein HDU98_005366, partial [Podochytrium sp. JEL0797]
MHPTTLSISAPSQELSLTATPVARAPLYEPADGKLIWGAWVDSEDPKTATVGIGGDSPVMLNQRIQQNAGVFQFSQQLPLQISPYNNAEMAANVSLIQDTDTDAILLLTVYPDYNAPNPFDLYDDNDIMQLAQQLNNLTDPKKSSRRVMLRFAPEMNGNWFTYSQQPTRFVTEYRRVVDAIRSVTPRVSFVWAPNSANMYPFGTPRANAELSALDTDGNGVLNFGDDPFTPYWPGADYVDWAGLSIYWKGNPFSGTPPHDNSAPPASYFIDMIQGGGDIGFGSNASFPFYTMFNARYNKPFMMAEGGAAFALTQNPSPLPLPVGAGELVIAETFWNSYFDMRLLMEYPLIKMICNFEYIKIDEDPDNWQTDNNGITRDYRDTFPPTLDAFKKTLNSFEGTLQWAVKFVPGIDPLVIGGGQTPQPGVPGSSGDGAQNES